MQEFAGVGVGWKSWNLVGRLVSELATAQELAGVYRTLQDFTAVCRSLQKFAGTCSGFI